MDDAPKTQTPRIDSPNHPGEELDDLLGNHPGAIALKFAIQTLGGVVPLAGGAIGAVAGRMSEEEQEKINQLLTIWLKRLEGDLRQMGMTMAEVLARVDMNDEDIRTRLESPEYMNLVNKAFRNWDSSQSEEKRQMIRNLLANATGDNITGDDVIAMFITWIDRYTETHFKAISAIYKNPSITRMGIWAEINGQHVRDDSAEADLFKFILHELSTGYVIRKERESTSDGQYLKAQRKKPVKSDTLKTPFDDIDPMELTPLGLQFVHYTLNELVPKIESESHTP